MKIFLKALRVLGAFIVASTVSAIYSIFMLSAVGETADRNKQFDDVQYTCAAAENYANCYRGETGRSLISLSGGGMSADTHLVLGSILTAFIFAMIFIGLGLPKVRKKILSLLDDPSTT